MKPIHVITFFLLVIGGLNWLLVGVTGWDVGVLFGGQAAPISRMIYVLVGLSALVTVATHPKDCKTCKKEEGSKKEHPASVSQETKQAE